MTRDEIKNTLLSVAGYVKDHADPEDDANFGDACEVEEIAESYIDLLPVCPHGEVSKECMCERCYVDSDFAYDASRESSIFGRR